MTDEILTKINKKNKKLLFFSKQTNIFCSKLTTILVKGVE